MYGMERFRALSPFAAAFAAEYKGFMRASGITGYRLAEKLGRNEGYVSERVNGRRPLDTEDVDALAMLVEGWTGKTLMIELARRVQDARKSSNVHQFPKLLRTAEVGGSGDDDVQYREGIAALDEPDWQHQQEEGEEYP